MKDRDARLHKILHGYRFIKKYSNYGSFSEYSGIFDKLDYLEEKDTLKVLRTASENLTQLEDEYFRDNK